MKKFFYSILSLSLAMGLFSCSNDDDLGTIDKPYTDSSSNEPFTLIAEYKDKQYTLRCTMQNDSLVFLDEDFSKLYNEEIMLLPDLARLVFKDSEGADVIKFYANSQELETKNGISYFNDEALYIDTDEAEISTKLAGPLVGRCILYDDTNFKDRTVTFEIDQHTFPRVSHLKPYAGFNDKTSAIRVYNFLNPNEYYRPFYAEINSSVRGSSLRTCFIGHEHDNFRGKKLYCVAESSFTQGPVLPQNNHHEDYKLKRLGWNDKITSTEFRIITVSAIGDWVFPH